MKKPRHYGRHWQQSQNQGVAAFDPWLLFAIVALLGVGLVMVTSASLAYAESLDLSTGYFAYRHAISLVLGTAIGMGATYTPLSFWKKFSVPFLILNLLLLMILLVPGVSREVNGSVRWLFLGPISIQVSEITKLSIILYVARYLVKHQDSIQTDVHTFLRPVAMLAITAGLLLLEPDFGAAVVISLTLMGLLFLGQAPLRWFIVLVVIAAATLGTLVVVSPYRLQRLTSFLDPWGDQFNTGYQLTQSLIAFGRGGWFGVGLGNSVQKLLYLPEPHTDFIFAVLAEELGLLGALAILFVFVLLVWRIFILGKQALAQNKRFEGLVAYGIGLWFGLQALINIGVNTGVLPTKGLTLPFVSYGGSSLVVGMLAIGIILRIEYELSGRAKTSSKRR